MQSLVSEALKFWIQVQAIASVKCSMEEFILARKRAFLKSNNCPRFYFHIVRLSQVFLLVCVYFG